VFAAAAVTLMYSQGHAQTEDNLLRGLIELNLVVEKLPGGAAPCGITEEMIRTAVRYPLSSTKIRLHLTHDFTAPRPALYINILTVHQANECTSVVHIEVSNFQKVTLYFSGADKSAAKMASVILWKATRLLGSNPTRHRRQVPETIEAELKNFITDWNLDNKP
jgi:hypothetical protein